MHQSIAGDLALLAHDDHRLRDVALSVLKTAQQPEAHTLSLLRPVPGIGAMLRRVWLYAIPDLHRFPRGQDVVSSCRLVTCAKESAGKRCGTAGAQSGQAYWKWAFSEAAGFFLRTHPHGQTSLARVANTQGQGKALTVLAPQLARAVSEMFHRATACARPQLLQRASGAERVSPPPNGTHAG